MTSPKEPWIAKLDAGPPMHEPLARLVEEDGAADEAEVSYYESATDPQFLEVETARRRLRAQWRRRVRHRAAKQSPGPIHGDF
ncbi:hypothetical protein [Nocardioides bruguierae]|uniref:Uncharacterized protein n=1 Tax=Nocardioides bruguierae TaxID=2945102 RepID=A0A9X2IEM9_9ACTN|nr:hypothetical protein [Nocardioides bruguierae]MCM0619524.1 hypothetical protein [Nocardioides bruguierae]